MLPSLFFLLAALGGAPPSPGDYRVVSDEFRSSEQSWGLFCGALPKRTPTPPGTLLTLSVQGENWTVSGARRRFGSNVCEGTLPNLAPTDRSPEGRGLLLRCVTRRVTRGTERTRQRLQVSPQGRIELRIEGQVEFRKDGDLCLAGFTRRTVLEAVTAAPTDVMAKGAPAAAEKVRARTQNRKKRGCKRRGRARELAFTEPELRLRPGEERCLELQAQDAKGCPARWSKRRVRFAVSPPSAGEIDRRGCFQAARDLSTDQRATVTATYRKLKARATVDIRKPDLSPPPEEVATPSGPDAGIAATGTRAATAPLDAPAREEESDATGATGNAEEENGLGLLLAGTAALLLVAAAVFWLRQQRMKRVLAEIEATLPGEPASTEPGQLDLGPLGPGPVRPDEAGVPQGPSRRPTAGPAGAFGPPSVAEASFVAAPTALAPGQIRLCTKCGSEFASGATTHCPLDGEPLTVTTRRSMEAFVPPKARGTVCPICFTQQGPAAQVCPNDGTALVADTGQFDG